MILVAKGVTVDNSFRATWFQILASNLLNSSKIYKNNTITSAVRASPITPLAVYPHLRLNGQTGSTASNKMLNTISKIVTDMGGSMRNLAGLFIRSS